MQFDTRMFERVPVADPTGYPASRKRRVGPVSQLDPEELAFLAESGNPPQSRLFPFAMTAVTVTRRTVSTPLLIGPAVLTKIWFTPVTSPDPPSVTLEIGQVSNPINEAGVALATPRPYANLIELLDPFAIVDAAGGEGIPITSTPNTLVKYEHTLNLIVTAQRFAFAIANVNGSPFTITIYGQIQVLEGLSPAALRAFTGS